MASIKKFEFEVELKSPTDAFWNTVKETNFIYPKLFPEIYESIEILEGDGRSVGTIRLITLSHGFRENLPIKDHAREVSFGTQLIIRRGYLKSSDIRELLRDFDDHGLGKTQKSKIEYVDEENKEIGYLVLEGIPRKIYKYYHESTTVKPKGNGSVVVFTNTYQKNAKCFSGPESNKDVMVQVFKKLHDYTIQNLS